PAPTQHSVNFTTSAAQVFVIVKSFPQCKQRLGSWLGSSIKKNADLWIKDSTESIEEPSMRIDLFAIFLLQTEHHLHWGEISWITLTGSNELLIRSDRELSCVLELLMVSIRIKL